MSIQKSMPIDENGNYDYELAENGDRKIVIDSEQIALFLKQRLQFYKKEWAYDIDAGVPWLQRVFKKNPDKNLIDSMIKTAILKTDGVTSLVSYISTLHYNERRLSIEFRYTDIFSDDDQELETTIEF